MKKNDFPFFSSSGIHLITNLLNPWYLPLPKQCEHERTTKESVKKMEKGEGDDPNNLCDIFEDHDAAAVGDGNKAPSLG